MSEETNTAQIVLYQSEGANVPVEVSYMQSTFWMPQRRIAELFGKDKSTISRHLKNIFGEGELDRDSVVANIATTAADGKTYQTDFHSLDGLPFCRGKQNGCSPWARTKKLPHHEG